MSYAAYAQTSGVIVDNVFIVLQIDTNNDGIVDSPVIFKIGSDVKDLKGRMESEPFLFLN